MLRGIPAGDMSFLAPYHRTISREDADDGQALEQKISRAPDASSGQQSEYKRQRRGTQGHKRLVFSDPVAFRYLEEDPATIVLDRRRRLQGYESYIVEQWVCSRVHPTFIICTYTGDMSHSILVNVLSVPADESVWSSRLKVYFQAVSQFHARARDTELGTLMVTNLGSFPSALAVIAVPDGDIKKHREDFIVNENLKRMGCAGRAGMNLQPPQASTVAKFHHLYRTSESVPLYASVLELVKLCQTALIMFGKLLPAYADGLLCDITEKAISEWWTDIGSFFYNLEPSDGILGPTTVAGLLGLLMGAYNRLKAAGTPVGKDLLDISAMKRAIGVFQRTNRLEKTRRLDRQTLDKLHRSTAKTASGEGWTVPKAVKSTVADITGKGGEMVMGIVGARDKAGIAEVETLDLDRITQLVTGSKMKWLFQGKPLKSVGSDVFGSPSDDLNGRVFGTDDQGNFMWTSGKRDSVLDDSVHRRLDLAYEQHAGEGRSGLGKIKDAVGIPSTKISASRQIKEEDEPRDETEVLSMSGQGKQQKELKAASGEGEGTTEKFPGFDSNQTRSTTKPMLPRQGTLRPDQRVEEKRPSRRDQPRRGASPRSKPQRKLTELRKELDSDIYKDFSSGFRYDGPQTLSLRRSRSAVQVRELAFENARQDKLPRNLSFSTVENTMLPYGDVVADTLSERTEKEMKPSLASISQDLSRAAAQRSSRRLLYIQQGLVPYVETLVANIENLDQESAEYLEEMNNLYYQRFEEYQQLRATSTDVVAEEKTGLTESLRRLEMLGAKVDYELTALQSRIQEVEDGVTDFERSVLDIEGKVKDLTAEDRVGKTAWFFQALNFFGFGNGLRPGQGSASSVPKS